MAITLKSDRELEQLRKAGSLVAKVLSQLKEHAKPGVSTGRLDAIAAEMTRQAGAIALFKGVPCPYRNKPFPGVICASVNEQLVHGIPSEQVVLREGDILSVDFGVKLDGYCGDSAFTVGIGQIAADRKRLLDVTRRMLEIAVERMAPGVKWSAVAGEMEACCRQAGFAVVQEYVGHGIGTEMHEEPKVPNFVSRDLLKNDIVLKKGMVLAVEPMVNMGTNKVKTLSDGWTVITQDRKCSAHFEHTIAVIEGGSRVLTRLDDDDYDSNGQ